MNLTAYFDSKAALYGKSLLASWLKGYESRHLLEQIPKDFGKSVLDLGCGSGSLSRALLKKFPDTNVTFVDLSTEMLRQLPEGSQLQKVHSSIEDLALDQRFDLILAIGVLEFLSDASQLWKTASAHAHPGTWLLVLYPPNSWMGSLYRRFHRSHGINIHLFSNQEIKSFAAAQGWGWQADKVLHGYGVCALMRKFT